MPCVLKTNYGGLKCVAQDQEAFDCGLSLLNLSGGLCRCGLVARVTLLRDKMTGHPTGTAYIQFLTAAQAAAALALTGSLLLQRPIAVMPKLSKPSHAFTSSMLYSSVQDASPSSGPQPYSSFASYHSGNRNQIPRGRGKGRGSRGGTYLSRGGAHGVGRGRTSEQGKSNVYIRPGLKQ